MKPIPPAASNAMGLMLWVDRKDQALVIGLSSLKMLVPLALQLVGWVTPFYRFEGDALLVVPHSLSLPPVATLSMLLLASLGTMLVASLAMRRIRDSLEAAQRESAIQRWTLEQLGGPRQQPAPHSSPPAASQ